MSVFKVVLDNQYMGKLDSYVISSGLRSGASYQRTMFVAGPNGTYRELVDGSTFTDCNYWKRYAYPQLPHDQAFIEVVTDDGSIYSTEPGENTFPAVYASTVASGATATLDFTASGGGYASVAQITINSGTANVALNGLAAATFPLGAGNTQIFNNGDMVLSSLSLTSTNSTVNYQVISSIESVCYT